MCGILNCRLLLGLERECSGLGEAMMAAYGWPIDLADAQILERLQALNLERTATQNGL